MDDRIDDILNEAGHDYHEPPATPRDLMWQRIQAARAAERVTMAPAAPAPDIAPARSRRLMPLAWVTGVAALLALGIGIGRSMEHTPHAAPPAVATAPAPVTAPAPLDTAPVSVAPNATPDAPASRELATVPRIHRGHDVPAIVVNSGTRAGASEAAISQVLGQHLGQSEAFLTLFRSSVENGQTERLAASTARQLLSTNRLLLDSKAGGDARSRQILEDLELVLAQIAQLRAGGDSIHVHLITEGMDQGNVLPRLRTAVPAGI